MKAAIVSRRGGPDVIDLRDAPEPQLRPGTDDVLIHVEAVGINFADTVQTQGMYPHGPRFPYIPGLEFAGKVDGSGDRVMGFTPIGACAERLVASRASLFKVPEQWTSTQAAAFPVNYFTAYFAFWMANMIGRGENSGAKHHSGRAKRVLIHAVAGGVGTAAVQVGKTLGVEMYGTASSDEKLARVKALGLQHAINYRNQEYEDVIAELTRGEGVDAVFEMLGGEHTATSTRCLADMGRLIIYGMATGQAPQFDFMSMFQRNLSAHALWLTPLTSHLDLMREAWAALSKWIAAGALTPQVGAELPLEKTAEAHRMLLERRNYGKVVVRP